MQLQDVEQSNDYEMITYNPDDVPSLTKAEADKTTFDIRYFLQQKPEPLKYFLLFCCN